MRGVIEVQAGDMQKDIFEAIVIQVQRYGVQRSVIGQRAAI